MGIEDPVSFAVGILSESGHMQIEADALRSLLFRFYCRGKMTDALKEEFKSFYWDNIEGVEYENFQSICDSTKNAYFGIGRIEERTDLDAEAKRGRIEKLLLEIDRYIVRDYNFDLSAT